MKHLKEICEKQKETFVKHNANETTAVAAF